MVVTLDCEGSSQGDIVKSNTHQFRNVLEHHDHTFVVWSHYMNSSELGIPSERNWK